MKKAKILVLGMSFAMILSSCGGGGKTFKLTFHQESVEDKIVEVIKDKTTNADVKSQEPEIVKKEGYDATWVYDVTKMESDLTINPTYTPVIYTATFVANGAKVSEVPFTVETTKLAEPTVPKKDGYEGKWEDYKIKASDMTINAVYSLKTYTLTFVAGTETVGTAVFDAEHMDINAPVVPPKVGYDGHWNMPSPLPLKDDTVYASYVAHNYTITFKADGHDDIIKTYNVENRDSFVTPDVPDKPGYSKGTWESFSLEELKDQEVHAIYSDEDLITYHANFIDGEKTVATREFTVKNLSVDEPEVPHVPGYENEKWETYTLGASDIDIHAQRTATTYYVTFYSDIEETKQVGEPVPFTVESDSIDEPEVPAIVGKYGEWSEYNLKKPENQKSHAVYSDYRYYVTFIGGENDDVEAGKPYYTVSNPTITEPDVPAWLGHDGSWPSYTIDPSNPKDFEVHAQYVLHQYTATFKGGLLGEIDAGTRKFTIESAGIEEPEVPEVTGYSGSWPTYTLGTEDIEIVAEYSEIQYKIKLMVDGEQYGEDIIYTINDTEEDIELPEVPLKEGNYASWESFALTYDAEKPIEVNALYVKKGFDFEDGLIPTEFVHSNVITDVAISSTEGTRGSKCLELTSAKNDFQMGLSKEFLKKAFALPWVNSIQFDAKASFATTNFRYDTPYGRSDGKSSDVFEAYNSDDGINLNWKTFYFTRQMFGAWREDSWMIKGASPEAGSKIYLDNILLSKKAYSKTENTAAYQSFESGSVLTKDGNNTSIRGVQNQQVALISGAGYSTASFDYTKFTDGNRSLKYSKLNGYTALFLSSALKKAVDDEGILVDIYTTVALRSDEQSAAIVSGSNRKFGSTLESNRWVTLHLLKSDITDDGRFLITQGSPTPDIYIDNIRPYTGNNNKVDFENMWGTHFGQYCNSSNFSLASEQESNSMRDSWKNYNIIVNGANAAGAERSSEHASEGMYSFKVTYSAKGYCAIFVRPEMLKYAYEKGLTFKLDIYVEDGCSFTGGTFFGNQANKCVGKWGTVEISGEELKDPANPGNGVNGRIFCNNFNGFNNGEKGGTFWIDNLRVE